MLLAKIYFYQGLSAPAEYYLKQGLEAAEKCHSSLSQCHLLFELARFEKRKGMYSEGEAYIQHAQSILNNIGKDANTSANLHLRNGDVLSMIADFLGPAEIEYNSAVEILEEAIENPLIAAFDRYLQLMKPIYCTLTKKDR